MSDWAVPGANAILDGGTFPTTLYVQAHVGDPGPNGTANVAADTRRVACTFDPAAGGIIVTAADAEVSAWAATETISHISIWGAATAGTCYFIDDCANVDINAGEVLSIAQGALTITLPVWV